MPVAGGFVLPEEVQHLGRFVPRDEHVPEFDDWKGDPMSAIFFTLTKKATEDPDALNEIGQNLGAGLEGVKRGFLSPESHGSSRASDASDDDEPAGTEIKLGNEEIETNGDASMVEIFSEDAREVAQDVENHLEGQQDPDEEAV